MAFFEDIDELGIVEHHAKEVYRIQDDQADQLLSDYREARRDLMDRLSVVRMDTFTAQHLRGVLAQVDAAIAVLTRDMHDNMSDGAEEISMVGVKQLMTEIQKFSHHFRGAIQPINFDAVQIALETKNFLVNQYKASLDSYSADLRKQITHGLTKAVIEEKSYSEVVQDVGNFFQDQEWKANQIARTELHNIYGQAKIRGLKEARKDAIPNLKKSLYHPMDSRTGQDSIELAKENPIIDIDEAFEQYYQATPKSKVQHFVFMAPPNRPNDRAILIPYSEDWDSED